MATPNYQAANGAAITPSSTVDLARPARGVHCTGAGTLVVTLVTMTDGTFLTFASAAGQYHPLQCKRIWATSTATGIIALYND